MDEFNFNEASRRVVSEFLEIFLNKYNNMMIPWTFDKDNEKEYIFMTGNYEEIFQIYGGRLDEDTLTKYYRRAIRNQQKRVETDMGIALFGTLEVSQLIGPDITFSNILAMFFVVANLAYEYSEHTVGTYFVDRLVDSFASYLIENYMDEIETLGGWKGFVDYFYAKSAEPMDICDSFNRFVETCRRELF